MAAGYEVVIDGVVCICVHMNVCACVYVCVCQLSGSCVCSYLVRVCACLGEGKLAKYYEHINVCVFCCACSSILPSPASH